MLNLIDIKYSRLKYVFWIKFEKIQFKSLIELDSGYSRFIRIGCYFNDVDF